MRRIIFFLLLLPTLCSFSQVKEDFSDSNLAENPVWQGDLDKFIVDKKGQLRLNDLSKNGLAYLSTPSALLRETTWTFYVHLYFNSSVSNYALFYLAATAADFNGEQDAFLIGIGGRDDDIILYRQTGKEVVPVIEGTKGRLNLSSPEVRIKVYCDKEGRWSLFSQIVGAENAYVKEGEAFESTLFTPSYAGLTCVYTPSRNTGFAFDDIMIVPDTKEEEPDEPDNSDPEPDIPNPDDTMPPKLLNVFASTDSTLQLAFDEQVNISNATFGIDPVHREKSKTLSDNRKLLTLTIGGKFVDNEKYVLSISKVKDIAGNYMPDSWINFSYYDATLQAVGFGDVVISEIMANPKGVNDLPEAEYVELFNRTNRPLNLNTWKFYYGTKAYKLPEGYIQPNSYAVLCHEKYAEEWRKYGIQIIPVKSFPELANTGRLLWLEDARGNLISWTEYSDLWYKDSFKKKGGFSLECMDITNLSNDSNNWHASDSASGGTPGKENSVKADFPDEIPAKIAYTYMLTPDTLVIAFNKPMNLSSLTSTGHYTIESGTTSVLAVIPARPQGKCVKVVLSEPLTVGDVLEMELQRMKDISGLDLEGDLSFKIGLSEDALPGEVMFNEILFNPFSDGSDYVELYNCSGKYIDMHRLYFSTRGEDGNMKEPILLTSSPKVLSPHDYVCFTKDISNVCKLYDCVEDHLIGLTLPSLPDDKGSISLLSPSGEVIDEMSYTEKMHMALLDDKEGVSLEKIYPTDASDDPSRWLSASTACGGGTPGKQNSQYRQPDELAKEGFYLERNSFTPDGDGQEDVLLISYHLKEENSIANVKVFDASGHLIKTIADNYRLASEGTFVWNGMGEGDSPAAMGLYIIYIETYSAAGHLKRHKLGCALTR